MKKLKDYESMPEAYKRTHDEYGREINPDPPVEIPVGKRHEPALHEMIKAFIRGHMSQEASKDGRETFEEFNDFGEDDEEPLLASRHEFTEMQEEHLREFKEDVKKMHAHEKEGASNERGTGKGVESAKETQAGTGGSGGAGAQDKGAGKPG